MSRPGWLITLVSTLALGACGDDSTGDGDSGDPDAGSDVTDDADAEAPVVPTCAELPPAGAAFEIDPGAPNTQIHGALAFDGEAIWVAYNLPNDDGDFEVWATRLGCDGESLGAAFRLHEPSPDNLVDPAVAAADHGVLITWQSDSGAAENNLDIWYAVLAPDGAIESAAAIYDGTRGGTANPLNAFMPAATATAGGFMLAGAWGTTDAPGFQVFAQRLTPDGQLEGEAIDGSIDAGASQTFPSVATSGSDVLLAWTQNDGETAVVVHTRIAGGTTVPRPTPAISVLAGQPGLGPSYVNAGAGHTYVSYTGDSGDVILARGNVFDGPPASIAIGDSGRIDHSPAVAAHQDRGAVAYYRNIQGFSNELWVQQFEWTGASFLLGRAARIDDSGEAAPYAPALLHLGSETYLAVWSDGTSPAFRLLARVVDLES